MKMMNPKILWKPDAETRKTSNLTQFIDYLRSAFQLDFQDYQSLWAWSVNEQEQFWRILFDYFGLSYSGEIKHVLTGNMPQTKWFEGISLNYAENIFTRKNEAIPAIIFKSESEESKHISWDELFSQTASLAAFLRKSGVRKGDRVAGYLPNIPQATVALLATASIGAIWSGASPDFGTESVLERFQQIEPSVFIAIDGYQYNGKQFNKIPQVNELKKQLKSLKSAILIPYLNKNAEVEGFDNWDNIIAEKQEEIAYERVDFSHPLWIVYSSGTTGTPKSIVHSVGGILLEHLKYLCFHNDLKPSERFFWYTTTGWMMWNFLQGSLLAGATAVIYDGSPAFPDIDNLWRFAEKEGIHHFGTSASFIQSCIKSEIHPKDKFNLSKLRSVSSTGSPLSSEGFDWIYESVKENVYLWSMSGGTDVCTAFVGGNPLEVVTEGEIQCRALGVSLEAWDENGQALTDEVGEMVITKAIPSMPVMFWNDPDFKKYSASYFEEYAGIWRHGDWVKISKEGKLVIFGRSDATLNRQGVRIGTAEIYRAVEHLPEISDSLVIHQEKEDCMILFVVLREYSELSELLKQEIRKVLRESYTSRHVPDKIIAVSAIPYTISGKKLEIPVKKILQGIPLEKAVNLGSVRNPEAFEEFKTLI